MRKGICGLAILLALGLVAVVVGLPAGARAQSDTLEIRLLYATFDPVNDGEPAIPPELRESLLTTRYALLQFDGPPQMAWIADLQSQGVTFYDYVPQHAYIVHLPLVDPTHDNVRWLGPYHPAYKLSPAIAPTHTTFTLDLFPDADLDAVATLVAEAGATVLESADGDRAKLLVVEATGALSPTLAGIEQVRWLQERVPMQEMNDDARWVVQEDVPFQTPLYERGLTGAGQVGAIADSGLDVYDYSGTGATTPSCFFLDDGNGGAGGAPLLPGPTHRKVISRVVPPGANGDDLDGSGHGTHVVGSFTGDQAPWHTLSPADGMAVDARVFFQDIGFGPGTINPPSDYGVLFGQAYDPNGDGIYQPDLEPRTHSNSWGSTDQYYSVESMQVDNFTWTHPDFLIFYAVGNQGPVPNTMGYPANAKSIVTVGGTENGLADPESMFMVLGASSSHGPAPDTRLKPTVAAPGDRIVSAASGTACGTIEKAGSSMATPIVHGMGVLVRQYLWEGFYPAGDPIPANQIHPSAALLKALLINSARPQSGLHVDNTEVDGTASWPGNGQGWGRVTAEDALYFQGDHRALWLHDEYALDGSVGFGTVGETRTFTLTVGDGAPFLNEPLKVVLAWSDYPAAPPAGALVNDLNLVVTDPAGTIHRGNDPAGNDFAGPSELPPLAPDAVNPWEVVHLADPAPGVYTVTASAASLPSLALDSRLQGFALAATGDLLGRRGRAEIEYPVYDVVPSSVARLRVTDLDLNANPAVTETVSAHITSTTAPAGVDVMLAETGPDTATFTGAVTLTTDPPPAGALSVALSDTIRLTYADADDGSGAPSTAYDTATVGALPVNFANPPQLDNPADPGAGDEVVTLNWSPAGDTSRLSRYRIQETTAYTAPLLDDAEGTLADNWVTNGWQADGTYQAGGANSFWSGRGDLGLAIDNWLALNRDVTLPPTLTTAALTFYSRYYNDFNDYGFVEISTDGGATWAALRTLYADPDVRYSDGRMRAHQLALSDMLGQPFRIRFRYNNGALSFAGTAPGWWVDNVAIHGGVWETLGTVPAGETSTTVTDRAPGRYFYRVQGLLADGSTTPWSNVQDVLVQTPLAVDVGRVGTRPGAPPWLPVVGLLALATLGTILLRRHKVR